MSDVYFQSSPPPMEVWKLYLCPLLSSATRMEHGAVNQWGIHGHLNGFIALTAAVEQLHQMKALSSASRTFGLCFCAPFLMVVVVEVTLFWSFLSLGFIKRPLNISAMHSRMTPATLRYLKEPECISFLLEVERCW